MRSTRANGCLREVVLAVAVVAPLVLIWRDRAPLVLKGRFWAEEGCTFFQSFVHASWFERIFFVHLGHLQLATNLAVSWATLVSLSNAPRVTTYFAFALELMPVVLLFLERERLGLRLWQIGFLGVALTFLPAAPEVFANMTNSQALLAVNTCTLLALPTVITPSLEPPVKSLILKFGTRGLLILGGLSGVPSTFWFPGFVLRAWLERDRERATQAALLGACALVQMALLIKNGTGRPLSASPLVIFSAAVSQLLAAPMLGIHRAEQLAEAIRTSTGLLDPGGQVLMAGAVVLVALTVLCVRGASVAAKALLLSVAVATALSIFGSLDPPSLVSGRGGARYFYAPVWGLLLTVVVAAQQRRARLGPLASGLILGVVIAAGADSNYHSWVFVGPPWKRQLTHFAAKDGGTLEIWPSPWTMNIPPTPTEPAN